jgi:signal transduction histidine kinase
MRRNKNDNIFRIAGGIFVSTIAFSLCFWFSYLLTGLIYEYTGTPSEPWTYIITGLLGLYIFSAGVRIIIGVHGKKHNIIRRNQMMEATLDAMERIMQGDFSVVLKVDKHDPFAEINETINKMANELGSMENLRQDFIANVSHEIQSPLTSISGFAELLHNNELTDEERKHYLDIIEAESKRLSKLSDNLLKLSSLDAAATPLTFTDFRLDKQIRKSLLMLEPQWSEKDLEVSLELEAVHMLGDEHLMAQVWINLLHNSIKFTLEGGSINLSISKSDSWVECRIADNGIGISEEDQLHIFERFYKVDKARDRNLGGNGLGLSLVKKIIELHKGTIRVESTVGIGTAFIIRLPK